MSSCVPVVCRWLGACLFGLSATSACTSHAFMAARTATRIPHWSLLPNSGAASTTRIPLHYWAGTEQKSREWATSWSCSDSNLLSQQVGQELDPCSPFSRMSGALLRFLEERRLQRTHRCPLHVRSDMRIDSQSQHRVGVPENLLDDLGIDSIGQE